MEEFKNLTPIDAACRLASKSGMLCEIAKLLSEGAVRINEQAKRIATLEGLLKRCETPLEEAINENKKYPDKDRYLEIVVVPQYEKLLEEIKSETKG